MADEHRGSWARERFVVAKKAFQEHVAVAIFDVLLAHVPTPG
jgi:hypothetical protein